MGTSGLLGEYSASIRLALSDYGYEYSADDAGRDFRFRIHTASGATWRSQVLLTRCGTVLRHFVYVTDQGYREDFARGVGDLAHLINVKVPLGGFIFDPSSGAAFYRYGLDLRGTAPLPVAFERMLNACAYPIHLWDTAFRLLLGKNATPFRAFNAALVICDAPDDAQVTKEVQRLLISAEDGGNRPDLASDSIQPHLCLL